MIVTAPTDPTLDTLGDDERFDFGSKLAHHPERARAALTGNFSAALSVVYLDVNTDICNHNCIFCDGFYRPLVRSSLPWSRLERLVKEFQELGVLAVVIAGDRGEPLIHPHIADLLLALQEHGIEVGLYTNGTGCGDRVVEALRRVAWLRISADAGTAETHRRMHGVRGKRDDFATVLTTLARLSDQVESLGASFVLDPINIGEIELAAEVLLGAGAHFVEYKPKYLPDYTIDADFLMLHREHIGDALRAARDCHGQRVVVNNQVNGLLENASLPTLTVPARPCLTSRLRLVISSHGCYTCTPYRGEAVRRIGDIMESSLEEILVSARRQAVDRLSCTRRCAYHDQNELLLAMQREGMVVDSGAPGKSRQHRFL